MSLDAQLNFRRNEGHVTDGDGETYVLATGLNPAVSDMYPTTRDGVTFGLEGSGSSGSGPRNASDVAGNADPRLGGYWTLNDQSSPTFRINLPTPGLYLVEAYAVANTFFDFEWDIIDDATLKFRTFPATSFPTANTTYRTVAYTTGDATLAFPDSVPGVLIDFSSTILRLQRTAGSNSAISHLRVRNAESLGLSGGGGNTIEALKRGARMGRNGAMI